MLCGICVAGKREMKRPGWGQAETASRAGFCAEKFAPSVVGKERCRKGLVSAVALWEIGWGGGSGDRRLDCDSLSI